MHYTVRGLKRAFWWARRDLNPHPLRDTVLSRARMPIPPLAHDQTRVMQHITRAILS